MFLIKIELVSNKMFKLEISNTLITHKGSQVNKKDRDEKVKELQTIS